MRNFYILVISDIHLGTSFCQARLLLNFLGSCRYELLIILGDLFEHGGTITDEQFLLIEYLRRNRHRVIYVDGNHDFSEEFSVSNVIGGKVHKKWEWEINERKFCAVHGYQFDRFCFVFSEPLIDKMFYVAISFLERMDLQTGYIKELAHRFHANFANAFSKKAIRYALRRHADVVLCGHTHIADHLFSTDKRGRVVEYINTGGWVNQKLCSYASIDLRGNTKLCYYMDAS